jgi:hypothetical protein
MRKKDALGGGGLNGDGQDGLFCRGGDRGAYLGPSILDMNQYAKSRAP